MSLIVIDSFIKNMENNPLLQTDQINIVFETMIDGVCITNQDFDILYANPVMIKDFGHYKGKKCYNYLTNRDTVCPQCKNKELFKSLAKRRVWQFAKNNKTYELVDTTFSTSKKDFSKLIIFRDISTQKETEERLKKQNIELLKTKKELEKKEEKFRAISEQSSEGITLADFQGNYIFANQAFCNMVGYSEKELLEKTIFEMLNTKDGITIDPELFGLPLEYTLKHKDNSTFPIQIVVNPIIIGEEKLLLGMLTDMTEKKQSEKELILAKEKAEESDRLKSEFLSNMSHEIRTPLNSIMGFSGLLEDASLSQSKRNQFLSILQNSGKQLLRVIDDILEISKLETKQVKVINKEICLNDLLMELFLIFDIKAKENNTPLYLIKGLSDIESTINIDESKLKKILSNLLENALKYTNFGTIELACIRVENNLEIYVKDTGIGISKENQTKIFERFTQADIDFSQNISGLGLGLSIAKENTELLGGKITLESEKGKGSTFRISFPYSNENLTKESKDFKNTKLENATSNKLEFTVLVAEDEEINFLYFQALLDDFKVKIKCLHAKNGQEAIDFCNSNVKIDIVLMDLKMPIMSGFIAAKEIRKINPELPIIAQTAFTSIEDKEKAIAAGCDDFISKPISKETLNTILTKFLNLK